MTTTKRQDDETMAGLRPAFGGAMGAGRCLCGSHHTAKSRYATHQEGWDQ